MPFNYNAEQAVQQEATSSQAANQRSYSANTGNTEAVEKSTTVRVVRKLGGSLTPSIKDALAGKIVEKTIVEEITQTVFSEYENYSEPFTREQLASRWKDFLEQISDRPNLIATLSNVPEIQGENMLLLKIGNSVQEEEVRLIKPELVNFLRSELRNSGIELATIIERVETERTHFNDSEKLQLLIQKRPELSELKQKFNLDFNA